MGMEHLRRDLEDGTIWQTLRLMGSISSTSRTVNSIAPSIARGENGVTLAWDVKAADSVFPAIHDTSFFK